MPYLIKKKENRFCVFKRDELTGVIEDNSLGCHDTRRQAQEQIQALYASEDDKNRTGFQKMVDLVMARWELVSDYFRGKEDIEEIEDVGEVKLEKRDVSSRELYHMLIDRINNEDDCIVDFYFAPDNTNYVITSNNGTLYKRQFDLTENHGDIVLGEAVKIEESLKEQETRTKIVRQTDGRVRWFSVSGTSVINRVGEIDSRELYDSFIENARSTGKYPIRMFWHMGDKFRTGQCDYLAREGNCYITSGLYDENSLLAEIEIAAREAEPNRYGESNGFESNVYGLEQVAKDIYVPVFRKGIHKEISTLVENRAASLFTLIR